MRWTTLNIVVVVVTLTLTARPSEACVQFAEANQLLGWSADGKLALFARVDGKGKLAHAELHPTRYEGWIHVVLPDAGGYAVRKLAVGKCGTWFDAPVVERGHTEAALRELAIVKAMHLVAPPTDDGGAARLSAAFVPRKRHALHELELREATKVVTTLPVPVWCVGSCLRDEDWRRWGATVTHVVTAGDRTLYVVRMKRVCNGGNAKDLWIDRVIAAPGSEARPKQGRCRGSGA